MLNIRPIPSVQNEKLDMLEKVRTKNKAWSRVVELTRADVEGTSIEKMAVVHVNAAEDAAEFTRLLHENLACPEKITLTELTPGLSVHTGAGLVAVAFVTAK